MSSKIKIYFNKLKENKRYSAFIGKTQEILESDKEIRTLIDEIKKATQYLKEKPKGI